MLGKVATPATAGTVTVPESVEPPGFAPKASVTLPVNPKASRLPASFACTTMAGAMVTPATVVYAGCVLNTSCVATPTVAVALKVAGEPLRPLTVAVAVCAPDPGPSVQVMVATPSAFVTDVGAPIEPPPVTAAQFTVTPGTTLANASVIVTLSGVASAADTGPFWRSPPLLAIVAGAPGVAMP